MWFQAFKLCSTGEDRVDLSYDCLISEQARTALADRIEASSEFSKSLQRPETTGVEDEEESDEDDPMGEDVVLYDEIDSSRSIDEEVETLMLQNPNHTVTNQAGAESDHDDVQIVGTHVERYTGHKFSPHVATGGWIEWDASSHM